MSRNLTTRSTRILLEMASSQKDFFADTEKVTNKEISATNPDGVLSSFDYWWCIMFLWDEQLKNPFECHVLNMFKTSEIKAPWLAGTLGEKSRMKKLNNLSKFPGQTMSLFGKVPKGNINKKCLLNKSKKINCKICQFYK